MGVEFYIKLVACQYCTVSVSSNLTINVERLLPANVRKYEAVAQIPEIYPM